MGKPFYALCRVKQAGVALRSASKRRLWEKNFSAKADGRLPHFNHQLKLAAINGCHKQDELPLALAVPFK